MCYYKTISQFQYILLTSAKDTADIGAFFWDMFWKLVWGPVVIVVAVFVWTSERLLVEIEGGVMEEALFWLVSFVMTTVGFSTVLFVLLLLLLLLLKLLLFISLKLFIFFFIGIFADDIDNNGDDKKLLFKL